MNTKIMQTLEFDKIKKALIAYTASELGRVEVEELMPATDFTKVQQWQEETEDGAKLLRLKGGMPIPKLQNIKPHLKRLEIGAMLNGIEIAQIGKVLRTTTEVTRFFDDLSEIGVELFRLYELVAKLVTLPTLNQMIREAIDEDGHVMDDASQALKGIRTGMKRSESNIREKLDSLIRGKNAQYLSDALVTMRNDRYVIPVKAEYRNHFGGVVHDQSSTGQTLFIEPQSVVDLNNKLRQLQIEERQEIDRILAELSNEIAPYGAEILNNMFLLGKLDFIGAKAAYGKNIKATRPLVNEENDVRFIQARHPLIDEKQAVANDILIGGDYQALVITGPNTGGKTITLKTLGLLQLMGQSGLQLPVAEGSQMGIFTEVFADIGDEQSIEQSLSTFSSHMTNIVSILNKIDDKSLILFDELGAGTDPQEGAALAIAILDQVGAVGSYVMATTHYPELKAYGYNRPGTINASMEFDVETLSPTYRLLIGVPGRSNAFEISKRLGLDTAVIDSARSLIDGESQNLNEMIADLENRRKMTEMEYHEVRQYVEEAEALYQDLTTALEQFFGEREDLVKKARDKANQIVSEAEEEASKIVSDLRKMQLTGQFEGGIKEHELIDAKSKLANLHHEETLTKNKVLKKAKAKQQFKKGDEVIVASYGQRGTLMEKVEGNNWLVQLGILKMKIKESDMTLAQPEKEPTRKMVATVRSSNDSHVSTQLDLRGERYESALSEMDQYLDAALLAGYPQVTIVHGKGTGALRQGVTEALKNNCSVKKFETAPQNQGGNGATIVYFS
ncbi:endonuclease MutS2 [Carnobacterium maltaromaticum]|uniref:endonuclease MutS2 n=1 Tax=Carnobacterium maltaromaticum TaxID=2751 RepID=UPI000C76030D|nr:endonuclease MutS2 [Carnobacterium maltaromaticum]PLS34841.1 endonuclease MutS2 [Carnobacterium maltaromaticum]PLS36660.1 endonuclease MutS2 [Carnobacterium maltaromaticum]PLS37475.1 endonuclease MutS2 [Carnobacterium maltaromaticum]PLS43691.1 endonuclease MutS2 [Carnobacterium maltaromaticum]PLS44035.1 endonuclease MutS2 [Carnobacterium maltaromaticum]